MKYIVVIQDVLEDSIKSIVFNNPEINFILTPLKNISDDIAKVTNPNRENLLIVINKSLADDELLKNLKSMIKDKINVINPHFLFITKQEYSFEEQNKIITEQNFYYYLPPKMKKIRLNSFLLIVFQYMQNFERLNRYIIQSFENIVDSELINKQKKEIENLYIKLEEISRIDMLANVLNRRALFEEMEKERIRTIRNIWRLDQVDKLPADPVSKKIKMEIKEISGEPFGEFLDHYGRFACMMIDIDHFKMINDTYGHLIGDEVIKSLGDLFKSPEVFRDNDIIGRYGGEEFVVILPETNADQAKIPAERLRNKINKVDFKDNEGNKFRITISIGITEFILTDKTCEGVISRADKALYYSKENGRNKVTVYSEIPVK